MLHPLSWKPGFCFQDCAIHCNLVKLLVNAPVQSTEIKQGVDLFIHAITHRLTRPPPLHKTYEVTAGRHNAADNGAVRNNLLADQTSAVLSNHRLNSGQRLGSEKQTNIRWRGGKLQYRTLVVNYCQTTACRKHSSVT